jgi:hypothetical protein
MSSEIDLSDETDPTERMVEQQERARDRAERDENLRHAEHRGAVETDDFDIEEALSAISDDQEA